MAWLRWCGGTGAGNETYLYKRGSWFIGVTNPSGSWYGNQSYAWVQQPTYLDGTDTSKLQMLCSTNTYDFTDYKTLHIKAKALNFPNDNITFGITTNKQNTGVVVMSVVQTVGAEVEYTLDITSATIGYLFLLSGSSRSGEVYEVWLEK